MSTGGITHVRIGSETRGPFRSSQLRELAEAGVITPATPAAASATGPWRPLQEWPEYPTLFPPRPVLQFKAAEFETVNIRATPPVDHREMIAWANVPPKLAAVTAATAAARPKPPNEAEMIVREVGRVLAEHAPPLVSVKKPLFGRRSRHYAVTAAILNVGIGVVAYVYAPLDGFSIALTLACTGILNAGLALTFVILGRQY